MCVLFVAESGATPKPLNTDVGDDDEDSDEEALKVVVKKVRMISQQGLLWVRITSQQGLLLATFP